MYVYAYIDTKLALPIYIGKGQNARAFDHLKRQDQHHFVNTIKKMIREENPPQIKFLIDDIDEEFAHLIEVEAIALYGRKDKGTGSLLNMTDGGEGTSGYKFTDVQKANMSKAKRGQKYSATASASFRAASIGRTYSNERNLKVSTSLKGHIVTDETRMKISMANKIAMTGPGNPRFNKSHSAETRDKIRKSRVGKSLSAETKAKMVATRAANRIMQGATS